MMKVGRLATPRSGTAALMAVLLSGCAVLPWTTQHERIIDLASGREISCAELARQVAASDFVLLGEQHDQAAHHQRRGALMLQVKTLGPTPVAVVAEHLPRGARVVFGEDLLGSLRAAGFRADLWEWPVHQALFTSVAATAWPLTGGNLRDDELRSVMKQGPSALPPAVQALLAGAPLDAVAQASLDADLTAAHGGSIPPDRLHTTPTPCSCRGTPAWASLRCSAHITPVKAVMDGKPCVSGLPMALAFWMRRWGRTRMAWGCCGLMGSPPAVLPVPHAFCGWGCSAAHPACCAIRASAA